MIFASFGRLTSEFIKITLKTIEFVEIHEARKTSVQIFAVFQV